MITRIAATVAALSLLAVSTGAFASESYRISARISDSGQEIGSPELTAMPGKTARVEVAGSNAYALAVTVEPMADGTLKLSTDLKSTHGDMAPVLVVRPGTPASVAVGRLSITVTAARSDG